MDTWNSVENATGSGYRPPGNVYHSPRSGGPRGGRARGRGDWRRPPPPFSAEAKEFVPRVQQWDESRPRRANWEDAPEFIPAALRQQNENVGSTNHNGVEKTHAQNLNEDPHPDQRAGGNGNGRWGGHPRIRGRGRGSEERQQILREAAAFLSPARLSPNTEVNGDVAAGETSVKDDDPERGRQSWTGGAPRRGGRPPVVGSGRFERRQKRTVDVTDRQPPPTRGWDWVADHGGGAEGGRSRSSHTGPSAENTDGSARHSASSNWRHDTEDRGSRQRPQGPGGGRANNNNTQSYVYNNNNNNSSSLSYYEEVQRNRQVYGNRSFDGPNHRTGGRQNYQRKQPADKSDFSSSSSSSIGEDGSSQRERLTLQVSRGTLECLVCCERVRPRDAVWSCDACYHVLHLACAGRWAKSALKDSGSWSCPACRREVRRVPSEYRCWCGKRRDPEWSPHDVAHGCGETCGRVRPGDGSCPHRCSLLCHPGPCPPCGVRVNRPCSCGRESRWVVCGTTVDCGATCGRALDCGVHTCSQVCHPGPCSSCSAIRTQECWCGKSSRDAPCPTASERYSCGEECGRPLSCGHHHCTRPCHEGDCQPCALAPDTVTTCPCGKVPLAEMSPQVGETESAADSVGGREDGVPKGVVRKSCLDPIPTCGQVCGKLLPCGQPGYRHECAVPCHEGPCPPCPLTTSIKCRCGSLDKDIPCTELTTAADDARCHRRCTKKRQCGKHKCGQECCIEEEHPCPLVCNRMLSCGQHRCDQLCHRGNCRPCLQSSFEELTCECGSEVILPPVPCGSRPPRCDRPCPRVHSCGHAPLHSCHSEPECPPCTMLVQRWCYGRHELRKAVPCHQTEVSCGRPCGRDLACGRHTCIVPCHRGDCPTTCTQPCTTPRQLCGHPCAAPCHDGPCPDTPCREMVRVTCECGHRSTSRPCAENTNEYRRIATSLLAVKMTDMQAGRTVEVDDLSGGPRGITLKTLECNDECKLVERNRRLAIGLQIRNPDLTAKLTPRYSEYMRQWAKKDPHFCNMVHERLTELVKLAKESKQKSRSYSFDPMNRDKRHFVHEYCEHFGCESVAYDQEPKRNVVATAIRDKSWLPSSSLLELIQRESGVRKIPKPVMASANRGVPTVRSMEVLTSQTSSTSSEPVGWAHRRSFVDPFDEP